MIGILEKSLIKWSALAVLGVSAYFLGYFWGVKNLESGPTSTSQLEASAPNSEQTTDFGKLK